MGIVSKFKKALWVLKHKSKVISYVAAQYNNEMNFRKNVEIIRNSPLFDEDYYRRNHIELHKVKDLAAHYLRHGGFERRDPCETFSSSEYLAIHADVAKAKMNPLVHYEEHGRNENREISHLQLKNDVTFPDQAVETERTYSLKPCVHHRTAILSCFFAKGEIPKTLFMLMDGLKEIADNIVLVGDCKIIPSELDKLSDYVCYAKFVRHNQYDFGSYNIGLRYARENGLLTNDIAEELVVLNDSCYGPVYPFSESVAKMSSPKIDFWGLSGYKTAIFKKHISSYFFVFKRNILDTEYLDEFIGTIEGQLDRSKVIIKYETELTGFLAGKGFRYDAICFRNDLSVFNHPVTFLKEYRIPLIKKKAFQRVSKEDINEALDIIRENNPELAAEIKVTSPIGNEFHIPTVEEHYAMLPEIVKKKIEKHKNGEKLTVAFLVSNISMFPSRPLYERMLDEPAFDPYVVIIPDMRWKNDVVAEINRQGRLLSQSNVSEDRIIYARKDELNRWIDICSDMDIVCYNTPYLNISQFPYNHKFCSGRDFLPIMVNYGFYRSKYDDKILSLDSYRYMWKSFFECNDTIQQYRNNYAYADRNASLVGYIKMDALAGCRRSEEQTRTRVLVALHHSIDGGKKDPKAKNNNEILNLGNFLRYLDFFTELPDRYPDIDFVYRPHPFLITTLKKPTFWGVVKTDEFITEMRSKPNVIWDDSDNYFQVFAESDACIQDCGSFLVEYQFTGKPCCYMLKSPSDIDEKFVELGKKCLDQCYIAYDTDAIDSFINDVVIAGNDTKAEGRDELRKEIMTNYPHAADAALDVIKKELGI
ncbi:MAG: hypothetical protein J6I96_06715 [Oscillospiraceae bacterium]|nr:hypothetical protein [Oscillospiraceae bacterium]